MSSPTPDWTAVVARLEKLERQNRRMKQAGAVALILAAAVLLMGQAPATRTVEANEFVLKDSSGTVRGRFSTYEQNTHLWLYDANGKSRMWLHVGGLVLWDNDGKTRAALSMNEEETILDLVGTNGSGAHLGIDVDGPGLILSDKDNKVLWKAP